MTSLQLSARLAILGAILLVVLETIRRYHQMSDPAMFTSWFDDYLISGFLIYGVWRTRRDPARGQLYLCAAWGAATVMMILSFIGQLQHIGGPDPAPVPSWAVLLIKGLLLIGAVTGLLLALRKQNQPGGKP